MFLDVIRRFSEGSNQPHDTFKLEQHEREERERGLSRSDCERFSFFYVTCAYTAG